MALYKGVSSYPSEPPFSPSDHLPEYPFPIHTLCSTENHAYRAVREALRLLELDGGRLGSSQWNPLASYVKPGQTVLIKPNFVRERRDTLGGHGDCTMTHGAIIRAVMDYCLIALAGRGRIIIADAPQDDADFGAICEIAGIQAIRSFYAAHSRVCVDIMDLRRRVDQRIRGLIVQQRELPGDPAGYVCVNLGMQSAFKDIENCCDRLYGSDYNSAEIRQHHTNGLHEYLVSRSVLESDLVIEVPKLKTHKKVGITANLKLLVGICGNKNWVAHYRLGTPAEGGDQFATDSGRARSERRVVSVFKRVFPFLGPLRYLVAGPLRWLGELVFGKTERVVRSGNWYGNDTAWRMAHDLYRVLLYADAEGRLRERPHRNVFSIVDGIVGGEGNGPLDATPRSLGIVLAGDDPSVVDLACARVMGFDWRKIPLLRHLSDPHPLSICSARYEDITVLSNEDSISGTLDNGSAYPPPFRPHFGWHGHVEAHPDVPGRCDS